MANFKDGDIVRLNRDLVGFPKGTEGTAVPSRFLSGNYVAVKFNGDPFGRSKILVTSLDEIDSVVCGAENPDYSEYCNGCPSYTGFTGHDPWCPYGGTPQWMGRSSEEYEEHRLSERFTLFIKIPAVYECNLCGSLATKDGRKRHLKSHSH